MAKRLYVGNLGFKVTADDLRAVFATHGTVTSVQIVDDPATGKSRGFGFVLMSDDAEAAEAIAQVDGTEFAGRRLNVNEAQPKVQVQSGPNRGPGRDDRRGFDQGPPPRPNRAGPPAQAKIDPGGEPPLRARRTKSS